MKKEAKVWIAGVYYKGEPPNVVWGILGVFSTKAKAKKECISPFHFIASFIVDKNKAVTEGPGVHTLKNVEYPLQKESKS